MASWGHAPVPQTEEEELLICCCPGDDDGFDKVDRELLAIRHKVHSKLRSMIGPPSSEAGWAVFEYVDCPSVTYSFTAEQDTHPVLVTLGTFVALTLFLAGWASSEFAGFEASEWLVRGRDWSPMLGHVYLVLMAYCSASCAYVGLSGIMIGLLFHRVRNQLQSWDSLCRMAVAPMTGALSTFDGLKGLRRDGYVEVLNQVTAFNPDFSHTLQVVDGTSRFGPEHIRCLWQPKHQSWEIHFHSPAHVVNEMAFRLIRSLHLPVAVVVYVVAQALKPMSREQGPMLFIVVSIIGFWMVSLLRLLWTSLRLLRV